MTSPAAPKAIPATCGTWYGEYTAHIAMATASHSSRPASPRGRLRGKQYQGYPGVPMRSAPPNNRDRGVLRPLGVRSPQGEHDERDAERDGDRLVAAGGRTRPSSADRPWPSSKPSSFR